MSITGAVVVFVIVWWLVFFAVLPWGVRTQEDVGETVPGSVPSAPERPLLRRKVLITTALTSILWLVIYVIIDRRLIMIKDLPAYEWTSIDQP